MNLLFVTYPDSDEPFVSAYDLDHPEPQVRQWRVDKDGVRYGINERNGSNGSGMYGVWGYLYQKTWKKLTQAEAFAMFPALQETIENWVEPW